MRRMIPLAALASGSCPGIMGVGQVVTLRVPVDRLRDAKRIRDVNCIIGGTAWGGYRTKFYPTYGCRALWRDAKRRAHP